MIKYLLIIIALFFIYINYLLYKVNNFHKTIQKYQNTEIIIKERLDASQKEYLKVLENKIELQKIYDKNRNIRLQQDKIKQDSVLQKEIFNIIIDYETKNK